MSLSLKEKCREYNYISFDIFDTLIKRMTKQPKDVFELVHDEYIKRFGEEKAIEKFADLRGECEKTARSRKQEEITLEEIYDVIAERFNTEITERYKAIEIETEQLVCTPFHEIKEVFDFCLLLGKKIYITSDMYLPKNTIEEILDRNGYRGYTKLFISCESGKTKASGSLYNKLLEEEGIKAEELLHIGDNIKSDIIKAKEKGISTFYINPKERKVVYELDREQKGYLLYKFISTTNPSEDIFSDVGYSCFGPLLFGMVSWIKEQIKMQSIEKVYFLSRDGYIMQKAYEMLKDENDVESYYFYASRRALQVAAICLNPEFEYVMRHMFVPRTVNIKWLLRRWGLVPEEFEEQVESVGSNLGEEFSGDIIVYNAKIKELYNKLKEAIIENSINEYKAFQKYLDEKDFVGNVAIVDIGWHGNMQNSIMEIITHMNRDVNVTGYYLGVVPDSAYQDQYSMKGFLFEKGKNETVYTKFKYMASMLELFFMAPHGTARRYVIERENVKVELDSFEFENTDTYLKIQRLQEKALQFVGEYRRRHVKKYGELPYVAALFERFTRPDKEIAESFGDLQIWDDKWITLGCENPVIKWILRPKEAIRSFINVPWKMGYLKRNLKLPLPYNKIVYKSREVYKKSKHEEQ